MAKALTHADHITGCSARSAELHLFSVTLNEANDCFLNCYLQSTCSPFAGKTAKMHSFVGTEPAAPGATVRAMA